MKVINSRYFLPAPPAGGLYEINPYWFFSGKTSIRLRDGRAYFLCRISRRERSLWLDSYSKRIDVARQRIAAMQSFAIRRAAGG